MVALQFLVLSVEVRILVRQLTEQKGRNESSGPFWFYGGKSFFLYHFCMINSQICKWRMTVYPYICALDIMEIQLILMLWSIIVCYSLSFGDLCFLFRDRKEYLVAILRASEKSDSLPYPRGKLSFFASWRKSGFLGFRENNIFPFQPGRIWRETAWFQANALLESDGLGWSGRGFALEWNREMDDGIVGTVWLDSPVDRQPGRRLSRLDVDYSGSLFP